MADIDVSYITEALNGKIDMPNGASQGSVDFVVAYKTQTESEPSWYRVYKSGWVEQGGIIYTNNWTRVSLPKRMANTLYTIIATSTDVIENATTISPKISLVDIGTDYFRVMQSYSNTAYYNNRLYWQVSGQIDPTELQRILGGN